MNLIQISAWYDSGGGFTHRLFDGHPALRVWPFELLLGQDEKSVDGFSHERFRGRYRWPRLGIDLDQADPYALFDRISDTELKSVLTVPQASKHHAYPVEVDIRVWREETVKRWMHCPDRSQRSYLSSYINAFFACWKPDTSPNLPVLGHCPIAILDAPEIWSDFPLAKIIHIIRDPLPGFAEMRNRHPEIHANRYAENWSLINGCAYMWACKKPEQVRILTYSDILKKREATMRAASEWLHLDFSTLLLKPSWNGAPLDERAMGPFGGVGVVSPEREEILAYEISETDKSILREMTSTVNRMLNELLHGSQYNALT